MAPQTGIAEANIDWIHTSFTPKKVLQYFTTYANLTKIYLL